MSGFIVYTQDIITTISYREINCLENGYVGKQTVALKECCAEYWLKEFHWPP